MKEEIKLYNSLLNDIRNRVRQGQLRANISANTEMLATYWDIGQMIHQRQKSEGWGKGVIPRLSKDLKNELPEIKGFSERNINYMMIFYREYSKFSILQPPVAKIETDSNTKPPVAQLAKLKNQILQLPVAQLNEPDIQNYLVLLTHWAHHIILIQKIKDLSVRYWYMQQCLQNGCGRDTLVEMIKSKLHVRQKRDLLRNPADEPTIGLILCQGNDRLFAEYALRDIRKPIGISEYELTRMLPEELRNSLPSVEEIEEELNQKLGGDF